jgi:cytidine deaminase
MTNDKLIAMARVARAKAYCVYSEFSVGAALIDENGDIHVGCNVENAAYPSGTCAEAGAISAMVVAGGTRIAAIAIVGGSMGESVSCKPCGGCRQRISEFSNDNTRVVFQTGDKLIDQFVISDLLPNAFGPGSLRG